jgi:hypothetical protein
MNLSDIEQKFMDSSKEAQKKFLKHNRGKLAKRNLLGRFYRLYARKNLITPSKKPEVKDQRYQVLFEPLAHTIGGDLDGEN